MKNSPESTPEHEEQQQNLKQEFHQIFSGYNINSTDIDALFKMIFNAYQQGGRAYHNLEHIQNLLTILSSRRNEIQNWTSIQLAAWLHDYIYDTNSHNNEKQSAQYARIQLTNLGIPKEIIQQVEALILATASHQPVEGYPDSEIFLDADLSILGANQEDYDKYAAQIRQEYSWVPEDQYRSGRTQILQSFLNRPRIYYTTEMHEKLDAQARRNIQREIEKLCF
jgi:predicted metal-dependent HD superfamily phosphohydrolase